MACQCKETELQEMGISALCSSCAAEYETWLDCHGFELRSEHAQREWEAYYERMLGTAANAA